MRHAERSQESRLIVLLSTHPACTPSRGRRSAATTPQTDSTKAFAAREQIPNWEQKVAKDTKEFEIC
jgi:hypothetical protein